MRKQGILHSHIVVHHDYAMHDSLTVAVYNYYHRSSIIYCEANALLGYRDYNLGCTARFLDCCIGARYLSTSFQKLDY
jgi:hypothetical protein